MFTAIITVIFNDGTSDSIGDGYAASGADELNDFVLELLTKARTKAQHSGKWIIGFNLTVTIS